MVHYVITGGGGFLGAHLISALQKNGDRTRCVIVDPHPRLSQFDTIHFDDSLVEYELGSFLDVEVLDRVLPDASTVFHLCAIGHTGKYGARKHRDYVYAFNVTGTKWLIEKCKAHGVRRFIYSSSIAVVFVGKPIYNCEETQEYPKKSEYLDIYSATKAEAEMFVRCQSTKKFKTTCLRFRAIYGPQDVTVAEKVVNMVRKNLFMVKISRHWREAVSNMSSGQNCGQAFYLANETLKKENGPHGEIYFITDGETIGQYSVWFPLIQALGKTPPQHSLTYQFGSAFVSLSSFFCYELFNSSPPMTRFELEVLVTDNTYSIEKAVKELSYNPGKNHFQKTVEYYRLQAKSEASKNSIQYMNVEILIFICIAIFLLLFSASKFI